MKNKNSKNKYFTFGKHLSNEIKIQYSEIKSFCKKIDIPYGTMNKYLSGRSFPPIETFIKICNALGKTPSYMLKPFLDIPNPDEKDLIDYFDIFQSTYKATTYKQLAKIMILGLDFLHLGKQIYGSEDPVENLIKFREAVQARLT